MERGEKEREELKKLLKIADDSSCLKKYKKESNCEKKIRKGEPKWIERYSNFLVPILSNIEQNFENLAKVNQQLVSGKYPT